MPGLARLTAQNPYWRIQAAPQNPKPPPKFSSNPNLNGPKMGNKNKIFKYPQKVKLGGKLLAIKDSLGNDLNGIMTF